MLDMAGDTNMHMISPTKKVPKSTFQKNYGEGSIEANERIHNLHSFSFFLYYCSLLGWWNDRCAETRSVSDYVRAIPPRTRLAIARRHSKGVHGRSLIDPGVLLGWWNGRHVRFRCVCPMGVWVQVPSRAPARLWRAVNNK
jgi:hypothetical protein